MTQPIVRPMLAATVTDRKALQFPYLASPKLDGIRCLIIDGKVLSRNLKPIRNKYITKCLAGLDNLDGELIVGPATGADVFNRTTRGVMSEGGEPDFLYHVFDTLDQPDLPFEKRLAKVPENHPKVISVLHITMHCVEDLTDWESALLHEGYEGVMLRDPLAKYKFGRATPNENSLWKLKQFQDGDMLITGVVEGEMNNNPAEEDALGYTFRSTHQENMVPSGMVGTLLGVDVETGKHMSLSPGKMTHDQRRNFFEHQDMLIGKIAKYKAFAYGAQQALRFATFQAFRAKSDMLEK